MQLSATYVIVCSRPNRPSRPSPSRFLRPLRVSRARRSIRPLRPTPERSRAWERSRTPLAWKTRPRRIFCQKLRRETLRGTPRSNRDGCTVANSSGPVCTHQLQGAYCKHIWPTSHTRSVHWVVGFCLRTSAKKPCPGDTGRGSQKNMWPPVFGLRKLIGIRVNKLNSTSQSAGLPNQLNGMSFYFLPNMF